jgi:hypothetical protein
MAREEPIAPKAMMAAATKNNEQNRHRNGDGINVQKPSRKGDGAIVFFKCGVVALFVFMLWLLHS